MRRHRHHHDVGVGAGRLEVDGGAQVVRQRDAGEVARVVVARRRSRPTSSASRPQSVVGACSLTIAATVVPHEPAPITATDVGDPTVGSIRGPMFPDASPRRHLGAGDPDPRVRAGQGPPRRDARRRPNAPRSAGGGRTGRARRRAAAGRRGVVGSPTCATGRATSALDGARRPRHASTAPPPPASITWRADGVQPRRRRARRSPRAPATSPVSPRDAASRSWRSCPATATTAPPCSRCPTDADFRFAYGPGSFRRHAAEARRLGLGAARASATRDLGVRRRRPRRPRWRSARRCTTGQPRRDRRPTSRAPRARARDRRAPRRHRVRVRRDAGEVGRRRVARRAARAHRRLEGHLGTRAATSPRSSPRRQRGAARRRHGARRRGTVHFLDAVDGELEADAGRAGAGVRGRSAPCAPTWCSVTTRGSVPPAPRPPPRRLAHDRRHRRRPRPHFFPEPRGTPHRPTRCSSSKPRSTDHVERSTTTTSTPRSKPCSATTANGARRWASTRPRRRPETNGRRSQRRCDDEIGATPAAKRSSSSPTSESFEHRRMPSSAVRDATRGPRRAPSTPTARC